MPFVSKEIDINRTNPKKPNSGKIKAKIPTINVKLPANTNSVLIHFGNILKNTPTVNLTVPISSNPSDSR